MAQPLFEKLPQRFNKFKESFFSANKVKPMALVKVAKGRLAELYLTPKSLIKKKQNSSPEDSEKFLTLQWIYLKY